MYGLRYLGRVTRPIGEHQTVNLLEIRLPGVMPWDTDNGRSERLQASDDVLLGPGIDEENPQLSSGILPHFLRCHDSDHPCHVNGFWGGKRIARGQAGLLLTCIEPQLTLD